MRSGPGGLGLNALQTALHLGIKRVLVVDKQKTSIDGATALDICAAHAFCTADPNAKPLHDVVAERGLAVDNCIDFVVEA